MDNKLIKEVNELQTMIRAQEETISILKNQLENKKQELMTQLNELNVKEYFDTDNELYVNKFSKTGNSYTDEDKILEILKNDFNSKCIRTKITESLDKKSLNKELKTDQLLQETLEPLLVKTETSYITVTSVENHTAMLEAMNLNKK